MKDKNLLPDNNDTTLEELTDQANQILESLENEKDLNNSVESYQQLLKLNNCLLYTSPSPRDLSTSRMPSSA